MNHKNLAITTALILMTLLGVFILLKFPEVLVMVIISLAVAAATRPIVEWLTERGMKHGLAVLLTYLAVISVFVGILILAGEPLLVDLQKLTDAVLHWYEQVYLSWPHGNDFQKMVSGQLPPPEQVYTLLAGSQGTGLAKGLFSIVARFAGPLSQVFAAIILSIYWTMDRLHFERLWQSLLPVNSRVKWRTISREIEDDLGRYIRSEAVQSILAGFLLFVGYSVIGMPFPVLLAIFGAMAWLVPWLGTAIALLPVALFGFWLASPTIAIMGLILTVLVLVFLELVIEPRLFKRRQYNSWLIILFLMALGLTFGVIGLVIAPPIATAIEIFLMRVTQQRPTEDVSEIVEAGAEMTRLRELQEEFAEVESKLQGDPELADPKLQNVADRLKNLLADADKALVDLVASRNG